MNDPSTVTVVAFVIPFETSLAETGLERGAVERRGLGVLGVVVPGVPTWRSLPCVSSIAERKVLKRWESKEGSLAFARA